MQRRLIGAGLRALHSTTRHTARTPFNVAASVPSSLRVRCYAEAATGGAVADSGSSGVLTLLAGLAVTTGLVGAGIIVSGAPPEEGIADPHAGEPFGVAHYLRVRDSLEETYNQQTVPFSDKLLPDELPPPMQPKYTLVVDLTDTLITYVYRNNRQVPLIRPGVKLFLNYLSQYYEIVIYTAQPGFAADEIITRLDPMLPEYSTVSYRLYRDATRYHEGNFCKDLKSLNRDVRRVIAVDDNPDDCKLDPDNCIAIKPWNGDPNDRVLKDLIPLLEFIAVSDIDDVREVIKRYEGKDMVEEFKKNRERAMEEAEQRRKEEEQQAQSVAQSPSAGRWGLFGRR